MTDEANGLLFVHSGAGKLGDDRNAGAVEGERHAEIFQGAAPVAGGIAVKGAPSEMASGILEILKQRLEIWHQLGRVPAFPLDREGDRIIGQINIRERQGCFGEAASLIDGDGPADALPVGEGAGFHGCTLGGGDLGLFGHWVGFEPHLGCGILGDMLPVDGLVQDQAQDSQIMNGGVAAGALAGASVFLELSPVDVVETHLAGNLTGRAYLVLLQEVHEVIEGAQVTFQRVLLGLVGAGQPSGHPGIQFPLAALSGGCCALFDLLGGTELFCLPTLLDRVEALSGGFRNRMAGVIHVPNPPERAASPLV